MRTRSLSRDEVELEETCMTWIAASALGNFIRLELDTSDEEKFLKSECLLTKLPHIRHPTLSYFIGVLIVTISCWAVDNVFSSTCIFDSSTRVCHFFSSKRARPSSSPGTYYFLRTHSRVWVMYFAKALTSERIHASQWVHMHAITHFGVRRASISPS